MAFAEKTWLGYFLEVRLIFSEAAARSLCFTEIFIFLTSLSLSTYFKYFLKGDTIELFFIDFVGMSCGGIVGLLYFTQGKN